jgi:hypothetical protein
LLTTKNKTGQTLPGMPLLFIMKIYELLDLYKLNSIDQYYEKIVKEAMKGNYLAADNLVTLLSRKQKFVAITYYNSQRWLGNMKRRYAVEYCGNEMVRQIEHPVKPVVDDRLQLKMF